MINETLSVTPSAVSHIQKMLVRRGKGIGMRLAVKETGCSGKSYQMTLIDETQSEDHVYPIGENIVLCVDPKSYIYIVGTTVDFIRKRFEGKFVFHNPNEKASCGCGESFHV